MTIEHVSISDPYVHEPKGISTAGVKQVYVGDGAGSGTWRRLTPSDVDHSSYLTNVNGWNDIADALYTSSSPLSLTASTRTKLTNNGLAAQTDTTRLGNIWSTASNTLTLSDANSLYLIRTSFKVVTTSAVGTPYTIKFEIESSQGPTVMVAHDTFIKGGSYVNAISFTDLLYVGSYVSGFPQTFYVTTDTNATLYNIGFVISRVYKES